MSTIADNAKAIFLEAVEKHSPKEWPQFLDHACGSDRDLRGRVEGLLQAHGEKDSLFDRVGATQDHQPLVRAGQMIGPYKIREQIGDGGMGVVYVAEQEKPLRRKVALKVIKPGMDSNAVLARFEAEQQALALMNHRNIAKVLDAGITESGHPYFVMELVSGISITEYCDDKKLTVERRLNLFVQVCKAIQHAHQKGIIHRDIKPTNVLVAEEDGEPIPKVIDFGVAKALNQKLTDRTVYTGFQSFLGTPLYASPEQASLSNVDVDTRSDVYSLGVLLYELLTGSTPFNRNQLQDAAYEEMCRIIREQQPMKPSTRLSTLGETASEVSLSRQSDPSRLVHAVRGDLDWIAMKTLEKDRSRRYQGANDIAEDVERFLKHEAIEARPPSLTYRLGRVLSRNKLIATTGSALLMMAIFGLGSVLWAMRARSLVLNQYRNQTLEVAFESAFSGSDERFEESYEIAKEAGISQDWLDTLLGAHDYHAGDCTEAIAKFDAALAANPENTSAWALKAVALVNQGVFYEWTRHIADYDKYEPRPEFGAIDELCMAYATYHVDIDEALARLEEVVEKHPTWNMARAIYAGALAEKADKDGDSAFVGKALEEISVAKHISPDNRLVEVVYVLAHNVAVREDFGDQKILLRDAQPVATHLAEKSSYAMGLLIVADYWRLRNQVAPSEDSGVKELQAWKSVAIVGRGNFAARAFAELFRAGLSNEVISARPTDPEAKIAQGFVLAHDTNGRREARKLIDSYQKSCDSWYMRLKLLELSFLIQDRDFAVSLCQGWLKSGGVKQRDDYDSFREEMVREFVGGRLHSLRTENDWENFVKQYFIALETYASGDAAEAKRRLEYCIKHPSLNVADHWARAFYQQWGDQ